MSGIIGKLDNRKENNRGSSSETSWERVDALTDEDIDVSDSPALTEEFFDKAKWLLPGESAPSRTDWARVDALSEAEIDTSDIAPLTEEDLARSEWRFPAPAHSAGVIRGHAVSVEVSVDEDILAWFQAQGQDYPQRMRAALRLYAEAHQASA